MTTIKSFTDLDQSKKLAEILPLESADMYLDYDYDGQKYEYCPMVMDDKFDDVCIPAWSLTALLNVLPRVDIEKEICSDTHDYRVKVYIGDGYIGDWYNNPIDACYEMIIKLHKLNLL